VSPNYHAYLPIGCGSRVHAILDEACSDGASASLDCVVGFKGPRSINVKISMQQLSVISDRMVSLRCYHCEVARKRRSLVEVSN
jgi:hypothetical protein